MKKFEADVCVVAAGLSGLAAAIAAAESGASVIALEKAPTTGGAANMGMGPLGIGTKLQKHHAFSMTPGEAFRIHMNFVHWLADARLVRDYYFKSGDTIQWLEDMGVEFQALSQAYGVTERQRAYATAYPTCHVVLPEGGGAPGPRCAGTMIKRMTERANDLGVQILLNTPAQSLIKEDDRVVGALATDQNGEEVEVRAKAVIIATGGMGDNPDAIQKYMGLEWGKDIFSFRIPGMVGDGINMAWNAGAGHTKVSMELMYQCPDNMSVFVLDGAFRQPTLWVNDNGQRFMNEDAIGNTTFTGNAILQQPKHYALAVMDSAMLKRYKKYGPDITSHVHPADMYDHFEEVLEGALESGYQYVFKADTVEELAEMAGIDVDAFMETVDDYNDMCDQGYDELFEKEREYMLPLQKGPFYAIKYFLGAYGTLGGIRINYKTEVVSDEGKVVPGLYAVGTDACNIYGDSYPFVLAGNTMGFCLNSGRIAGENAADFSLDEE